MCIISVKPFGACFDAKIVLSARVEMPTIDLVLQKSNTTWIIFGANSIVQVSNEVVWTVMTGKLVRAGKGGKHLMFKMLH